MSWRVQLQQVSLASFRRSVCENLAMIGHSYYSMSIGVLVDRRMGAIQSIARQNNEAVSIEGKVTMH